MDVVLGQELPGGPELLIDAAERGATVSRDETTCVETRRHVALALHHRQAHQGLRSRSDTPVRIRARTCRRELPR